jgi:hypothetical protein
MEKLSPKEFALQQIAPYFKDKSTCGVTEGGDCSYLTADGKMCVAGKNMLPSVREQYNFDSEATDISSIFAKKTQSQIFNPEAVDVLTNKEWSILQVIHDNIALSKPKHRLEIAITELGLFTYEELVEYSNKII